MVSEFTTRYSPGPAFAAARKLEEQEGFREQVRWWKEQEAAKRMRMVGVLALSPDSVVVVFLTGDFGEAHALATSAPFVSAGVLTAQTMSGGIRRCVPPT